MHEDDFLPGFRRIKRLYLGAEAELLMGEWASMDVVIKRRITKGYRRRELDKRMTWSRTMREAIFMHEAKAAGVLAPTLYHLNPERGLIIMSFENFPTLGQSIITEGKVDLKSLGRSIGFLHNTGIVHGDLTLSNILVTPRGPLFLDFGLSEKTREEEMFAEDLHLLGKSLEELAGHGVNANLEEVMEGYSDVVGTIHKAVRDKVIEISRRGRYVRRGQVHA